MRKKAHGLQMKTCCHFFSRKQILLKLKNSRPPLARDCGKTCLANPSCGAIGSARHYVSNTSSSRHSVSSIPRLSPAKRQARALCDLFG